MTNENSSPGWGLRLWAVLVGLVLVAPTLIVVPLSFAGRASFAFPPKGWSLRWYQNIWQSPEWRDALLTSFQVGLLVTVVATLVGTAAAVGLHRRGGRLSAVLTGLLLAPMVVPGIVAAVAIYGVFLRWRLTGNLLGFVLAHCVLAIPFVLVAVSASLRGSDPVLLRAAASMGAGPLRAFWRVTLPSILPGVASGALFAFTTSFDEVVAASFLQSPRIRTLPVEMFVSVTNQVDPTIAAVSTVVLTITTLVVLLPMLVRTRSSERQALR
ncbi:ABC transporter permease [Streptosporangium sp. NPDC051022]|uniref:ABC transporter permease n=1 Tax=Streptosporangium sp. NPDC051022 TaxID=3155752 RepID=UPI00341B3426